MQGLINFKFLMVKQNRWCSYQYLWENCHRCLFVDIMLEQHQFLVNFQYNRTNEDLFSIFKNAQHYDYNNCAPIVNIFLVLINKNKNYLWWKWQRMLESDDCLVYSRHLSDITLFFYFYKYYCLRRKGFLLLLEIVIFPLAL